MARGELRDAAGRDQVVFSLETLRFLPSTGNDIRCGLSWSTRGFLSDGGRLLTSNVESSSWKPLRTHPAFLDCRTEAIGRNACRTPQELPRQSDGPDSVFRWVDAAGNRFSRTHLARLPVGFSIFYKIPKKFIAAYPPANKRRSNLASAQRGRGTLPPSAARRWRGQASRDRDDRVG